MTKEHWSHSIGVSKTSHSPNLNSYLPSMSYVVDVTQIDSDIWQKHSNKILIWVQWKEPHMY